MKRKCDRERGGGRERGRTGRNRQKRKGEKIKGGGGRRR